MPRSQFHPDPVTFARTDRLVSAHPGHERPPLIRPVELALGRTWTLSDGSTVAADDVFSMFVAARDGDLTTVMRLAAQSPLLATVEYNYTPPIHFAVREGHMDVTAFLLDDGADPAYRSYPFNESLLTFAEERGHAAVAALLHNRLAARFAVAHGTEALIAAAGSGNLDAVRAELTRDPALAGVANETGDTALHHAATQGHLSIVEALIDAGANVDAERGDGYRPIHSALMPNWFFSMNLGARTQIADLLLSRGAQNTIFIAALRGDDRFVRTALARDYTLANFEDSCHHRVLSAAVRRHDVAMTRLLLDHGADPNGDEEGAPRGLSLWIAVTDRQHELVPMLLAHGADPNAMVESSGTPMMQAKGDADLTAALRAHGGHVPELTVPAQAWSFVQAGNLVAAEELLRANPGWLQSDTTGWGDGVLAAPARDGCHDVIAMLMRVGATVPAVSKWAPNYYFKHEATAAFLLANGMDANHMNWHRFTLLHHMAAKGEIAKAILLLDHGADINAIDDEYRSTPLGIAARFGQVAMVELLLTRGADPVAAGAAWATPVAWARTRGHTAIAHALRSAGA
jgi:ankyrin repeat protein